MGEEWTDDDETPEHDESPDAGEGEAEGLPSWLVPEGEHRWRQSLEHPLRMGDEELGSLLWHEPTGAQFRRSKGNGQGALVMAFGSALVRQPAGVIDRLRGADAARFFEVAQHFFGGGSPEGIGSGSPEG